MPLTPQSVRLDLKCGNSGIAPGKKCHAGSASTSPTTKKKLGVKGVLAIAAGAGLVSGAYQVHKAHKAKAQQTLQSIKDLKHKSNSTLVAALKTAKHLNQDPNFRTPAFQQQLVNNIKEAQATRQVGRQAARAALQELKGAVAPSRARVRGLLRGKRDSVWAEGFMS